MKIEILRFCFSQVAKSIKLVLGLRSASIVVSLDKKTIEALQLNINAYTVQDSILKTPKIKLKENVRIVDIIWYLKTVFYNPLIYKYIYICYGLQHIRILDDYKLEINPPYDRNKYYFDLHWYRNRLPSVVVKVSHVKKIKIKNKLIW